MARYTESVHTDDPSALGPNDRSILCDRSLDDVYHYIFLFILSMDYRRQVPPEEPDSDEESTWWSPLTENEVWVPPRPPIFVPFHPFWLLNPPTPVTPQTDVSVTSNDAQISDE